MPKVSVIVPVHNPGKYLEPCLDSLCKQTLEDIEIILIDDGSTDGSRDILKQYESLDHRIQIFFRQTYPNEKFGQKYSADLGRSKATGEYIIIIDHDDKLTNNALEILYNATENGTIDVVQGRNLTFNENNELIWKTPNIFPNNFTITSLSELNHIDLFNHMVGAPVAVWACLIKRTFQTNLELADCVYNDTNIIFKLKITASSFRYISSYIYIQHGHKESVSHNNADINAFQVIDAFHNLEQFLKELGVSNDVWKLYTLYKIRTLIGHSESKFSSEKIYHNFLSAIQKDLSHELYLPDLVQAYFSEDFFISYMYIMNYYKEQ